jgi:hypothetical protein
LKSISEINLQNPNQEDLEAINYYLTRPEDLEIELRSVLAEAELNRLIKEAEKEEAELKEKEFWGTPLKERRIKK